MSAHSIHLQDKRRKSPKLFVYRIWRKSLQTQECVRLIHGKRAIGVRAIEVLLYIISNKMQKNFGIAMNMKLNHTSTLIGVKTFMGQLQVKNSENSETLFICHWDYFQREHKIKI